MRALVLAAGLIAAHPAYADEIKVESGAPWRCALTSKEKLPPPGVIAKVSIELGANGALTTLLTGVMKVGTDTIEQDFIGAGSWRQIGDQLRVELKSFRNTRMTVNGEAVSEERLQRENEAGAHVVGSMSWGELKVTQLTETRLSSKAITHPSTAGPAASLAHRSPAASSAAPNKAKRQSAGRLAIKARSSRITRSGCDM